VPPSEEHLVVRHLRSLAEHMAVQHHDENTTTLMAFHDPVVRACIHEAKFAGNAKAWRLLGEMLAAYITATYQEQRVCIVPVPLSGARLRSRGYNQVVMVLKGALPHMKNAVWQRGLLRRANVRPQTELNKKERKQNIQDTFARQWFAKTPEQSADTVYILLDDVLTTGATIQEAKRVMRREYGIKPHILALAH